MMALPALPVAVRIGVTVPEKVLTTWAVFPFGVIAMTRGPVPTLMALPGLLVAVRIGITVPEPEVTYEVFPLCQFGRPIVDGDQAAVPWSAQTKLVDGGTEDLAGVSLLRFDASGLVLEHFLSGARRSAARRTAAGSAAAPMRLLHLSMLTRNRPQRQQGRYAALWHSWLRHA